MFERTEEILKEAVESGALPGAAYAVGRGDEIYASGVLGSRQLFPERIAADAETLWDLASLSKLTATTMIALRMIEEGRLGLYDPLPMYFDHCGAFADATVWNLMTHTSGLTPHISLDEHAESPADCARVILSSEPVCRVGENVNYSCMGYILLGKLLEQAGGAPLDVLAGQMVFEPLGMKTACYNPVSENVVTTEYCDYRGGYIKGQVHDGNAWFLGGVSGNAGVFASLSDMCRFAAMLSGRGRSGGVTYLTRRMFDLAVRPLTPGMRESRGLGFQLRGEGCAIAGDLMTSDSYGHSGFTGTALYVDAETGVYGLLLTNSVHFGRNNRTASYRVRRMFYNSLMNDWFRGRYNG